MRTRTRTNQRRPGGTRPPGRPRAGTGPGSPRAATERAPRLDAARPHHWFAYQLVQVLSARRPVHALLGFARSPAYDQLADWAAEAPLRSATTARRGPEIRRVGACRPAQGVIEAFARVGLGGGRVCALAFRLERSPAGRWACCAVELGAPSRAPEAAAVE